MNKVKNDKADIIFKKEGDLILVEVRLSKELRKQMEKELNRLIGKAMKKEARI